MAAVKEGGEPPPDLLLHWACSRYHSLPAAGGVLDQDAITLKRMQSLANVYDAVSHYVNSSGVEIHSLTEGERRVLRQLKDAKLMFVLEN